MRQALARLILLAALFVHPPLSAGEPSAEARTLRLARAIRLWGAVRFRHPWLLTREVDWDAALVRALPRVAAAAGPEDERVALAGMLEQLGDPATRLFGPTLAPPPPVPGAPPPAARQELLPGEVLSLRLVRLDGFPAAAEEAKRLQPAILAAKAVLLDLREQPRVEVGVEDVGDELELLAAALSSAPLRPPALRQPFYSGYQPQSATQSGGYFSGLLTIFPPVLAQAPLGVAERAG